MFSCGCTRGDVFTVNSTRTIVCIDEVLIFWKDIGKCVYVCVHESVCPQECVCVFVWNLIVSICVFPHVHMCVFPHVCVCVWCIYVGFRVGLMLPLQF